MSIKSSQDHIKYNSHLVKTGMIFGKLTVIYRAGNYRGLSAWKCLCDCGKRQRILRTDLINSLKTQCYDCDKKDKVKSYLENSTIISPRELDKK